MNQYTRSGSTPTSDFTHLLLGDLSGIQEFIFNTQSEGAAKTLKARSYYVQAVSEIALSIIEEELGADNCMLFYNGGGNFYVFCKQLADVQLQVLREVVQGELEREELYLNLSVTDLKPDFNETWDDLHSIANRDKLLKFTQRWTAFDQQERRDTADDERSKWKDFVRPFVNQKATQGFDVVKAPTSPRVEMEGLGWAHWQVKRSDTANQYQKSIVNKLPVWDDSLMAQFNDLVVQANLRNKIRTENDPKKGLHKNIEPGDIIEFEVLGQMAEKRTGTDKIAVLKMDADNLGNKFRSIKDIDQAKDLSDLLKVFFDETMLTLWQKDFGYFDQEGNAATGKFQHNVYPVFSGGDDCMFIGGWDAIFEFARTVSAQFVQDVTAYHHTLTLSASLTIFDSKYPVVRLSQLADEALSNAKAAAKNSVSVFGEVFSWDEFSKAHEIAKQLERLIKREEEPRGILERIKLSHRGFEKLQERALNGNLSNPAIWRLFYFIRKTKNLAVLEPIMVQYERALLTAITKNQSTNPAVFPVAARWAEFLTR